MCTYLVPPSEDIPEVGIRLCCRVYKWWKSDCPPYCKHVKGVTSTLSTGRGVIGVVVGTRYTDTGDVSIRVSSFSPLQTGDKLTTGYGQKGVAWIMPEEDMIYGKHPVYGNVRFDIVMACSSIVNRLTTGQVIETVRTLPNPKQNHEELFVSYSLLM
jgi:hypothetical protein